MKMMDLSMVGKSLAVPSGSRWQRWESRLDHPMTPQGLVEVWLSKVYLVQVYMHPDEAPYRRLSIRRVDGSEILERWDELQAIKNDVYGKDAVAFELFPNQANVVNVANIRHLWISASPMGPCVWKKGQR